MTGVGLFGDRVAEVDYITEYFLLGSLVSWSLALALALICR